MNVSGKRARSSYIEAYRETFDDYACKLDRLQRLIDADCTDVGRMEGAIAEVARARLSQNAARDRLARELVGGGWPEGLGEHDVRETARFLWELAGRPADSAERDWRLAEQLVNGAAFAD